MKRESRKPTVKIETIEEFKARGGHIRKVDFSNAYSNPGNGWYVKSEDKTPLPTKMGVVHKRRLDQSIINRKGFTLSEASQ